MYLKFKNNFEITDICYKKFVSVASNFPRSHGRSTHRPFTNRLVFFTFPSCRDIADIGNDFLFTELL